ncbi:MAG: poly-beta-1,6-N-acetyl-D-glucosamine biosynthesis protein PgaD [Sulfuricurvum sp.]|uniref:poly-beta-1,6-N-acetyl-D-glucosamine biosynthesis protein PgaD n=1 Tax=Sulfuricurvum sp. TaxID=2025608 RepID=UPI0027360728|nr:poly-beta-1,6-N-acetyl-D-glucosamine biosynthesis protein PgaD [Sulfuricurvum sp.]MDP2851000.1 poly-beta-1,6-N-acetyl-D-glucosamine biosynthesis protein PgaD [Sulfuricurvum sp.]
METLIINKRHEQPKRKRWLWDALTIGLWLGFIYLWKPLLIVFYGIITLKVPADEISDWIYENIHSVTFEHAVYMLVGTPIVLFILSRLNRHRAPSEHLLYKSTDYSNYFHLDDAQLHECANSQFVTVYHNELGHIIRLNNHITKSNE